MTTNFDKANRACVACRDLALVGDAVLDHKCAECFYANRLDDPHGDPRYGISTSTPVLAYSRLWSLTMLAVLAIGSFVLASLTAGAVVPAGVRPQNADSRLLKFGPADNQIEWVPTEAIALLRESHSVDLSKGADALRTIHPELA
ncbi:hypothetical protein FRC08_010200, partial [Ceratobasidium sp. 394]